MYYRRKLILGLLEKWEGSLSHTKLQKVLFLVTRKQENKSFDFVPYRYGSYSFQANQDLMTMTKMGMIEERKSGIASYWKKSLAENYFQTLKNQDQSAILATMREINGFDLDNIIKYTYINYPYYATKSQIAKNILGKEEFDKVQDQIRKIDTACLFTIGYEGISLESYLNRLIVNDVRLLCDVRKNSLSMKYGFSKSQLRNACESIGIQYLHMPDLGIDSSKRTELNSMKDYERLFKEYEKVTLKENYGSVIELSDLINEYGRVAITCFEKDPCMCHRSKVADALKKQSDRKFEIKNL